MAVNEKTLKAWRGDILRFSREALTGFLRPDHTRGVPVWSPMQRDWLKHIAALRRDGVTPRYARCLVVSGKRAGKTTIAATACVWRAALWPSPSAKVYTLSNSLTSAQSLSFDTCKQLLAGSALADLAIIETNRIRFRTGSEIVALPASPQSVAGLTASQVVSDEGWIGGSIHERCALLLQAQSEQGQFLAVTQSPAPASFLYRMWQTAQAGRDPDLWAHWTSRDWLYNGGKYRSVNPYIDSRFLLAQREALGESLFGHYFLAEAGSEAGLLDPEDIAAAFDDWGQPRSRAELDVLLERFGATRAECCFALGLDRCQPFKTTSGDNCAAVWLCRLLAGPFAGHVLVLRVWVSAVGGPDEIVGWYDQAGGMCGVWPTVRADPYQSADLVAGGRLGGRAEILVPSAQKQQVLWGRVAALFGGQRIHCPGDAEVFRAEIADLRVDTTHPLPRFAASPGLHDDTCAALSYALEGLGPERESQTVTVWSSSDGQTAGPETISQQALRIAAPEYAGPAGVRAEAVNWPDQGGKPAGMDVRDGQLYGYEDIPSTEEALQIGQTLGPDGEPVAT